MSDNVPHWKYRFANYKHAFVLLREAIEAMDETAMSQLEKEGIIQRFEYTMELAWKVMKDYLENEGVTLAQVTPRAVIRAAFETRLIRNGQDWMAGCAQQDVTHLRFRAI